MKLSRIQTNALRLCVEMANRYEVINAKTFGLRYKENSPATLAGKSNTGSAMLMKLVTKGYLEKIDISYHHKNYVVLMDENLEEYVPN